MTPFSFIILQTVPYNQASFGVYSQIMTHKL